MIELTLAQRLERMVARQLLDLPSFIGRRLAGGPIKRDGQQLDAQVQMLLRVSKIRGGSALQIGDVAKQRRQMNIEASYFEPETASLARVENTTVAGGENDVPARIFIPSDLGRPAPAVVFYHGGGFTLGSLDSHDGPCRVLANEAHCIVIAVDYRLAPEHPAPAAVEDAILAFRDVAARSDELGIDPKRIAVAGDSAGGNLAAVVAQQTVSDAVAPCYQLLFYPKVDEVHDAPSISELAQGFMLEKESIDWYREQYLSGGALPDDPRISPIYGVTADLAPAFVVTAGFDPLRDEGEAYAGKLKAAGVPSQARRYPELIHGFINMAGPIRAARRALDEIVAELKVAIHSVDPE